MPMDKITKEELKNLFDSKALSDDELEMVTGGETHYCEQIANAELQGCLVQRDMNTAICYDLYYQFMAECVD